MNRRFAVVTLGVAIGLLAACTSSSDGSAPPQPASTSHTPTALATSGQLSAECARLASVAGKIAQAQADLYKSGSTQSLEQLRNELRSLRADAPAQIKTALAELADGFIRAHHLLANPTNANKAELAKLQSKLATDASELSNFAVTECPG